MTVVHPFEPFIGSAPKILILGSFPSVKSRETGFYYGHKRNRFWKVISSIARTEEPHTTDEKKAMLDRLGIALWDTVYSCEITGSSDASIRNVVANDIRPLLEKYGIKAVFANGATSGKYYARYIEPVCGVKATVLPSTSPANAAWNEEMLEEAYSAILEFI